MEEGKFPHMDQKAEVGHIGGGADHLNIDAIEADLGLLPLASSKLWIRSFT
jgi:hypothetical protein